MKRVSKLFAGCLCVFAMASIICCKDDGGSDELKASVNKATAASVTTVEGTYDSVVTKNDKDAINAAKPDIIGPTIAADNPLTRFH